MAAVSGSFGSALRALDERLARQLQACSLNAGLQISRPVSRLEYEGWTSDGACSLNAGLKISRSDPGLYQTCSLSDTGKTVRSVRIGFLRKRLF